MLFVIVIAMARMDVPLRTTQLVVQVIEVV